MSLVAYDSSDSDDSVQGIATSALSLSKKGSKRQSGPVKIRLPTLDKKSLADSDEEDEDLVPLSKRKAGGSGLTALLPQPKLAPGKLVSKSTSTVTPSSQSMVPYSLSRHGQAVLGARRELKKKGKKQGSVAKDNRSRDNSDSEDEDEPVSFFSHLNSSPTQPEIVGVSSCGGVVSGLEGWDNDVIQAAPSAPKPFSKEASSVDHSDIHPALVTRMWEESVAGSDDYIQVAVDSEPDPRSHPLPAGAALPGAGPGLSMDDEAFRRLTGARKKRGRDPALNDLIEIKEDDVKVGMETYRKNFTEESVEKMYKAPDGSKPTAQQKRKHQLSFLAHHAKENELKLLKQWAQSAATRRDTQMKYGF